MSMLTERKGFVNEAEDQGCPESCTRRYEQLRRLLGLIDQLAAATRFQSTLEIMLEYNERHGTRWHFRTFLRDMQFLEEAGLVDCELREDFLDRRTKTYSWKLNLERSEVAQTSAIALIDEPEELEPDSVDLAFNEAADPQSRLWDVWLLDSKAEHNFKCWAGLTKREVANHQKRWREGKTGCVLMAWPQWLPTPEFLNREKTEFAGKF